MARFLLAIDQGTTGSTALVLSEQAEILGRANREFPQHFPSPGLVEHDVEEIWTSVLEAVRTGHCFIGFDFLSDTTGFSFTAGNKIQGDEIPLQGAIPLKVQTPIASRIVIYKNGAVFLDESGVSSKEVTITERGIYRAEVYLPQLGNRLWILSNPVYVR